MGILNAAYEAARICVGRLKHGDKVSHSFPEFLRVVRCLGKRPLVG